MTLGTTALVGIAAMFLLMFMGMPIAVSMIVVSLFGISYVLTPKAAISLLTADIWKKFSDYGMLTIPLFTLMGTVAAGTGIGAGLFNAANKFFGHLRGGLGLATTVTCALFGAMCGSFTAEVMIMSKIALPEMRKHGYSDSVSCGCIAASGGLAILIPPSGSLIVYGILTGDSIVDLFAAGIVPGIILTILFCITLSVISRFRPEEAPRGDKFSGKERLQSLKGIVDFVILVGLCLAGILAGWFTASEAGAFGAGGAILLGIVRGKLNWKTLKAALAETTLGTGSLLIMLTAALLFGHFMVVTQVPTTLSNWIVGLGLPRVIIMIAVLIFYFLGGCVMDALPLWTITVPILYPLVTSLGYSGIWFGICTVLITIMGTITPPVGMSVFVLGASVEDVPLYTIFRGAMPFLFAIIICSLLMVFFPSLCTWLPSLMH